MLYINVIRSYQKKSIAILNALLNQNLVLLNKLLFKKLLSCLHSVLITFMEALSTIAGLKCIPSVKGQ